MKLDKILFLMLLCSCAMSNWKDISIYGNALTISLPNEIQELRKPYPMIGDDLKYITFFANPDSSIKISVEFRGIKAQRFISGMLDDQVALLRHFNASLLIIETREVHQNGSDMLSILYELPQTKKLDGIIVERRLLFTSKGLAITDVMNSFKHPHEKTESIKLVKSICKTIKANNIKEGTLN